MGRKKTGELCECMMSPSQRETQLQRTRLASSQDNRTGLVAARLTKLWHTYVWVDYKFKKGEKAALESLIA